MTWTTPSGSARHQAIGGAMGSLGGEITSTFVNPAGLGFYKTGEIVISPGLRWLRTKGSFRGSDAMSLKEANNFTLGTSGLVWGWSDKYSKWKSKAFSIAVNRTANFKQDIYYSGNNDYSSFSENAANEFFNYYTQQKNGNPGLSNNEIVDRALNSTDISLLTKQALYTYLVDVDTTNGQNTVISRAEQAALLGQENHIVTNGGITEIAVGFAANMDEKLYIGGSFGLPIVNYKRTSTFTETDATGTGNNEFGFSEYTEDYKVQGLGINLKLGMIFKPVEYVRLGLAIHSPTLYGLKDNYSSSLTTNIDAAPGTVNQFSVTSAELLNGQDMAFSYDLVTPFKFLLSGSYVLREIEDVRKQRGFLTADIEYTNYKWSSFTTADEDGDNSYYKGVNNDIDDAYKGAFNFRAGGELKFNTIMTRLGFAYYGNPYRDTELKARRMYLSGGLGYRNKGIFIDLTYVHQLNKDVSFPYRLAAPRLNTFATLKESGSNVMLTFGFKI
jgi:long-subunit fatty acid transport protein